MFPAYCAIMAITAYIIPHYGDGPFWPQKTWHEAENCKKYWWTNLLFISNFIDAKNQVSLKNILCILKYNKLYVII